MPVWRPFRRRSVGSMEGPEAVRFVAIWSANFRSREYAARTTMNRSRGTRLLRVAVTHGPNKDSLDGMPVALNSWTEMLPTARHRVRLTHCSRRPRLLRGGAK